MDVLTNYAAEITKAVSAAGQRRSQGDRQRATTRRCERLQADTTLSRADRLTALGARVDLARIDSAKNERHPRIPAPLLQAGARGQRGGGP